MPEKYRIFISSPGDVGEERVIAGRIIERLAGEYAQFLRIEPILWEHEPLRATGHFQEQIFVPADSDLVICMLWSRLGTRLPAQFRRPDGSEYASGTEWEFENAAEAYRARGTPDLLVYRKTREAVTDLSDRDAVLKRLEQKEKLEAFIDSWFGSADDSFKAAFHTFETADEFEGMLETHLRKIIEEKLPAVLTEGSASPAAIVWHKGSPFRGLETFELEHAPVFFGRTRAATEIKEALQARAIQGVPFLVVFGMSGSGKTSLVRAGVLPTITQPGVIEQTAIWRHCIVRPTDLMPNLFEGFGHALIKDDALPEIGETSDGPSLPRYLPEEPAQAARQVSDALLRIAREAGLAAGVNARLALIVDQLEELFTIDTISADERQAFVRALDALARTGEVWIIGTMRSDFYHRSAEVPDLVKLMEGSGQYHLLPLSAPEFAQVIRGPARAAGLAFEIDPESGERLDDVLLEAAAANPAALPLLEFTLEELFRLRSDQRVLTFEAYRRLGGLEGALARRAEEVYGALSTTAKEALPAVLRLLVTVDAIEGQPAARRVPVEVIHGFAEGKTLVDAFVAARLFVTDRTEDGTAVVRIAHEALLTEWPRLKAWIEEDLDFLLVRARVRDAATQWRSEDQDPDYLLSVGKPLSDAEVLLERRGELDPEVVAFIEESVAAHRSRLAAAEAEARRKLRQARIVAVVVSILAILAGIGGYLGYSGQLEAERNAKVAETQKELAVAEQKKALINHSLFLTDLSVQKTAAGDATLGALLALEALPEKIAAPERPYVPEAEAALYQAYYTQREKVVLDGHEDRVHYLAYSPDGNRLATASYDKTVRLWDPNTGRELASLVGHGDWVTRVQYDASGKLLLTASDDGTARLWDAESGRPITVLRGHERAVREAVFSPDGGLIVTGSWDKTARIWRAADGEPIAVLRGHGERINDLAISPDGELIATASADGTARIWDTRTGASVGVLRAHADEVFHVAFSPDGRNLITTSSDKTAKIWDRDGWTEKFTLAGHRDVVNYAVFHPSGMFALTASFDGTARLWNVASGAMQTLYRGHADWIINAAFSPDGKRLVTASRDNSVRIWDTRSGREIAVLGAHSDWALHAVFSPDGSRIATASRDETARIWETKSRTLAAVLEGHESWIRDATFSADGARIATASDDRTARLWNGKDGSLIAVLKGHADAVSRVQFDPSGERLVTASEDGTARLWDARSGDPLAVLDGQDGAVRDAVFSPDGTLVATAGESGAIRLWSVPGGELSATLRGHEGAVSRLAFAPSGETIASAAFDRTARIWHVASGTQLKLLEGHGDDVRDIAFSPDGELVLTTANDGLAILWNAASGEILAKLAGHGGWVLDGAFSPNGSRIATASTDKTVRIWDTATRASPTVLEGHRDWVSSVRFGPDGIYVATASEDGMARLWVVSTGSVAAVVHSHKRAVTSVAFSPDGSHLLTTSEDGTARLMPVFKTTQALIDSARGIVPRRLTAEERILYYVTAD